MRKLEIFIENIIFASRWIQLPIYIGLIFAGFIYIYKFLLELFKMYSKITILSSQQILFSLLTLIDISLVTNLLIMVIIGGYTTFVSKIDFIKIEDKPNWIDSIDAPTIKIKLAMSIIIIAAIDLLRSFVDIYEQKPENIKWQIIIFGSFLAMLLVLVISNRLTHTVKNKLNTYEDEDH